VVAEGISNGLFRATDCSAPIWANLEMPNLAIEPQSPARLGLITALLPTLLLCPCGAQGRSPSKGVPSSSSAASPTAELPSEEIFARFASRILLLTCDVSSGENRASGVLVSLDGFVVTNAHVVEGCSTMTATQINGTSRRSYGAVLKYYDKMHDTAVLKIDGGPFDFLKPVPRIARVGERIYAIGNPKGLEQSITAGIVSGLRTDGDGTCWIQHDAPIWPGSSGGALISSRGELLGINSWMLKDSQGINFAVPVETLARAYAGARGLQGTLRFPGSPPAHEFPSAPPTPTDRSLSTPPSAISRPPSSHSLRSDGLVHLNVTVSDKAGNSFTNLPQSAFTVLEDGVPQRIKFFGAGSVPVSQGLVLDNSADIGGGGQHFCAPGAKPPCAASAY
jgi:hypothetical protein